MQLVELTSPPRRMLAVVFCLAAALAVSTEQALEAATQAKPPKPSSSSSRLTLSKARATKARSRRPSRARARAAANAKAVREAQEPHFKFDETGALVPDIRAEAAIIYDPRTGQVLWEQNSQVERSIASITKVMTAAVVLENTGRSRHRGRDRSGRTSIARPPPTSALATASPSDGLLHLLLIGSDNAAARVLARTSSLGSAGFIRADEREGGGTRAREHRVRRSRRPLQRQRVVGVRHGAAHQLRVGQRAHGRDHAHAAIHASTPAGVASPCRRPISW